MQINPFSVLVRNLRKLGITTAIRQITFGVAFTNLVVINTAFEQLAFITVKTLGLTSRLLDARNDCTLPQEFSMGLVSATWSSGHILIPRHRQIWSIVLPLRFVE